MDFFIISTTGDLGDEDLVVIRSPPEGLEMKSYCMARGARVSHLYPEEAKIFMDEELPGIKLSSLIGNTLSYLIVSSSMKDAIEPFCADVDVEYLRFTLHDHRKRVYSRDYFIVNPIGSLDCLDEMASGVEYGSQGSVVHIKQLVLDRSKVSSAPGLFRVDKDPSEYVVSEGLARVLRSGGFTNVSLQKLEASTGARG